MDIEAIRNGAPSAPRPTVRPGCRAYAVAVALLQVALLAAIYSKGGTRSLFPNAVVGLTLFGAVLLAVNQPIGRSVFIPAAILQIVVLGFAGFLGLLGLLAAWLQQSGAAAAQAAVYTCLAGGNAMLLLTGIPLVMSSVRRDGGS